MSIILGPNPAAPRSRNVVFSFSEWDAATWTAAPNPLAGAPTANLVTRQPVQVAGYDLSAPGEVLQLDGVFTTRQPVDVVSIPYATATPEATWRVQVGDSTVDFDGVQVADATGNGHTGQRVNGGEWAAGKYEGGLALANPSDATEVQYLRTAAAAALVGDSKSYVFWLQPLRLGPSFQVLVNHAGAATHAASIALLPSGAINAQNGESAQEAEGGALLPGLWAHVAVTYDHATQMLTVCVDGTQVAAVSVSDAPGFGDGDGALDWFGTSASPTGFDGVVDDVRYYTRALTLAEIQAEMQSETPTVTDGSLVFQYRLNAYDSGTLTFGAPPNLASYARRAAYLLLPYRMTNRRVRITIEDPGNAAFRIGRLMVGTCWQPPRNFDLGYRLGFLDDTKVSRTPTSQTTTSSRVPIPFAEFTIRHLQQDEILTNAYEIQRAYGSSQPVLVCLDPEDDRHLQRKLIYGLVSDLQPLSGPYHDLWEAGFRVEAML